MKAMSIHEDGHSLVCIDRTVEEPPCEIVFASVEHQLCVDCGHVPGHPCPFPPISRSLNLI